MTSRDYPTLTMIDVRDDLKDFCLAMEAKLREHDAEKGNSWKDVPIDYLREKFKEEFDECGGVDKSEFVDMANICMMLWNRHE